MAELEENMSRLDNAKTIIWKELFTENIRLMKKSIDGLSRWLIYMKTELK